MTTSPDTIASDTCPPAPADRPTILPHLVYDDVEGAVTWLCDAFGFREDTAVRHLGPDGRTQRTQLQVVDSLITVGGPSIHGSSPAEGVSTMLYVHVDDVDAHHRIALDHGAHIDVELGDAPWGDRRYQAKDPEGHVWTFAQPIADGTPPGAHPH